jgi:hypothetical protein
MASSACAADFPGIRLQTQGFCEFGLFAAVHRGGAASHTWLRRELRENEVA